MIVNLKRRRAIQMQMNNVIYKIIRRMEEGGIVNYTIELIPSCFIYKAHFPEEPITPGVCIVQIGKELIENLLSEQTLRTQRLAIEKIKNVKFLSVIAPNETKTLTYQIKKLERCECNTMVDAQLVVLSEDKAMAKISLVMNVYDRG